jgi:hypothetical protein
MDWKIEPRERSTKLRAANDKKFNWRPVAPMISQPLAWQGVFRCGYDRI